MALISFVCWGNICRSAMAEQIAKVHFERAGLPVQVDSAGVSSEELGNPMDRRAARCLREHGYPVGSHRAKKADQKLVEDSLLVMAFEPIHVHRLARIAPDADNIHLLTEFDPTATGTSIADPWYGGAADFEETRRAIEAAMPGLIDAVRAQLAE